MFNASLRTVEEMPSAPTTRSYSRVVLSVNSTNTLRPRCVNEAMDVAGLNGNLAPLSNT